MTNEERAEMNLMRDDITKIAQWQSRLQSEHQTLHDRLTKLEKVFSEDKSAAKFEKRVKKATIDGGDKDIPRGKRKEQTNDK